MKTSQLAIESRVLFTIRADDKVWSAGALTTDKVEGALVRLYPPAWATDVVIAHLKASLLNGGAASIRVMPKPSVGQVVAVAATKKLMTTRQTVSAMVAESNSANKEALASVCSAAMDEAGV